MLTHLSIQNYALIEDVSVTFDNGFSTITGETGAGKSIILGGLGLILGNRADSGALKNPDKKSIIEAEFDLSRYDLNYFFTENDIDYQAHTIIRREILPGGKSRAFINDTPVLIDILAQLHELLIDIHSQHQTLQINQTAFQFDFIDAIAGHYKVIEEFRTTKKQWEELKKSLEETEKEIAVENQQHEYNLHLFNELHASQLKLDELHQLETELDALNHSEIIQTHLSESVALMTQEELGIDDQTKRLKYLIEKIKNFSPVYTHLYDRIQSISIEFKDISDEILQLSEHVEHSPELLQKTEQRIALYYQLFQKHRVNTTQELLDIQQILELKIAKVNDSEHILEKLKIGIEQLQIKLNKLTEEISFNRKKVIPTLENQISSLLHYLGMAEAIFKIDLQPADKMNTFGNDRIQILFSANKGLFPGLIQKTASGGELSRIMLALKSVYAQYKNLPTIIFDEIDAGVSGEIALKMGEIMHQMSKNMQVIAITHLPQIAAKGNEQFKVYKENVLQTTLTNIKKLTSEDRISEIAEMLGGKNITETAINHAKELLKN